MVKYLLMRFISVKKKLRAQYCKGDFINKHKNQIYTFLAKKKNFLHREKLTFVTFFTSANT